MPVVRDKYAVVGNPVAHSRSPEIHQAFAAQFGATIEYAKVKVEDGGFATFMAEFIQAGGAGLNITVPLKPQAFAFVDEHDELALSAGAVNTIKIDGAGSCRGFNTDGIGLLNDLVGRYGLTLSDARILLLGAGGAAQGVLNPLLRAKPRLLVLANRTLAKARQLVAQYKTQVSDAPLVASALSEIDQQPDIIINATSAGLNAQRDGAPGALAALAPHWLGGAFCYDMSYGPAAAFCRWAAAAGAKDSVDGLGMLVEQAAESYYIWREQRPQTEPVLTQLRGQLNTAGA